VRIKIKGPLIQRRNQVDTSSTTDQRLLDSRGPADWVHTDPWRVVSITTLRRTPRAGGKPWGLLTDRFAV